jgi:hypothetical protein
MVVTINDKHLEKHEQHTGDKPLDGAQITKPEDSAVKQRQELINGLKSHRITKDGNAFTIDMGDGETVQDVRAGRKPISVVQPKPFDVPSGGYNKDYAIGPRGRAPDQNDGTQSSGKPPWSNDNSIPIFPGKFPEAILPGEGDYMPKPQPDFHPTADRQSDPLPHGWEQVSPVEASKLTLKAETSIDKNGHIVTTETRADGSTFATAQAIGADNKLHVVSTELKDSKGNSTIEKFDPLTGRKIEELKDTGIEKTDTKYNANGHIESKDTTSGLTGKTDHEVWLRSPLDDKMVIHLKNGIPEASQSERPEPSIKQSAEAIERGWPDPIKIVKDAADACRETLKLFGGVIPIGSVHEIDPDVSAGVIDQFGSWLNDARRADGEFNSAIVKDHDRAYISSGFYGNSKLRPGGNELHLTPGLTELNLLNHSGDQEIALMHTHPSEPGMDSGNFSEPDLEQARNAGLEHPNSKVRAYLLTPDKRVMVYDPKDTEHPRGRELGHFQKDGTFLYAEDDRAGTA